MPDPTDRPTDVLPWSDSFAKPARSRDSVGTPPPASGAPLGTPVHLAMPGLDPMKPGDVLVPGPVQQMPPRCPRLHCGMLLYPVANDMQSGNLLLECLTDPSPAHVPYQVVFRVGDGSYGPRPATEVTAWQPPLHGAEAAASRTTGDAHDEPRSPRAGVMPELTMVGMVKMQVGRKKKRVLQILEGDIGRWIDVPGTLAKVYVCHYCQEVVGQTPHTCHALQMAFDQHQRAQRILAHSPKVVRKTAKVVPKIMKKVLGR